MDTKTLFKYEKELIEEALNKLHATEYSNYLYGNLTPEERGYASIKLKRIAKLLDIVKKW